MNNMKIENVVASTDIKNTISLNKLLNKFESSEYEPEQFPGLVYRIEEPKASSLIFKSGKIICLGTKNIEDAVKAMKIIINDIKKTGVKIDENNVKIEIQNIVAAIDMKKELDLNELAFKLESSEYEPEQFPGLVYRIEDPKVSVLLFSSGRIVCAGAKDVQTIEKTIKMVKNIIK